MPTQATDMSAPSFLRLLLLGSPKVGKTYTTLATCEKKAYVINCDGEGAMQPAKRVTTDFAYDTVPPGKGAWQAMQNAIAEAKRGAKVGEYKTVVLDTFSIFAQNYVDVVAGEFDSGNGPNGKQYWPVFATRLRNILLQLKTVSAHLIVLSHWEPTSTEIADGATAKAGPGILPAIPGKSRAQLGALFDDIIFMEKKGDKRVFTCSIEGVTGPGCRSVNVSTLPADISELWKHMQQTNNRSAT